MAVSAAVAIDAELFVPHSRPRLFVVTVAGTPSLPTALYPVVTG